MDSADDLTFRIIFSGDGAGRLRDQVKEKLKEFMGDYTDDTLVEYVIVLLKNGRRKEEARNELNVFLGDDSDFFVSWLWDHLRSNLDLYAQSKDSCPDEVAKQKPLSESEGIRFDKLSKSRRSRDWKGIIRDPDEPPLLRSAVIANIQSDNKNHMKRSPSPQPLIQRKRGRSDERGQTDERSQLKREAVSKPALGASRRLLQFAVRDAVATSRSTGLTSEPSFKRLRSVVSTPTEDSPVEECRSKIHSVARVPNAMAVVIKAVADAAKDVVKVKPSGNVFDRLGRSADISDTTDPFTEDYEKHEGFNQTIEATVPSYCEQFVEDLSKLEHEVGISSDFAYNKRKDVGRRVNMKISQFNKPGGPLDDDSTMLHYSGTNLVDGGSSKPYRDQHTSVAMAYSSHKMVNISSNVNTWKSRRVSDVENQKPVLETELGAVYYRNPATVSNGNGVPIATIHVQKDIQKTLPFTGVNPSGRPTEDADSRTIFVSNVHFGASKDSLLRHFNKFGDVVKVVIVTEAATGQPKGSAYVEFMRKEAAENALSFDSTSFMSRILKVVRKTSANQEAAPVTMTWQRVYRGSPFTASSRSGRAPFLSPYRSRLPMKGGARSLQWKRGAQNSSSSSDNIPIPSPTARSLTYVRTEAPANKTDINPNNA